jgi:hypothetical protein
MADHAHIERHPKARVDEAPKSDVLPSHTKHAARSTRSRSSTRG